MKTPLASLVTLVLIGSFVVVTAQEPGKVAMKAASGKLKAVGADRIDVAGSELGKNTEWQFGIDAQTVIRRANETVSISELSIGDWVHVQYTDSAGKAVARNVRVKVTDYAGSAELWVVSGTIKAVTPEGGIVWTGVKGDLAWSFVWDEYVRVEKSGKAVRPAEVKVGDMVQMKYVPKDGLAVAKEMYIKKGF